MDLNFRPLNPFTILIRKIGFILLIACTILFLLQLNSYANNLLQRFEFSSLKGWQDDGDVKIENGNVEINARKGKIEKTIPLSGIRKEFILIRAKLKLEGIKLGERKYQAPTLILEVKGKGERRSAHWIRSGEKNWHTATVTSRISKESNQATIILRNNAESGRVVLKEIAVWSANKDGLHGFDYPEKWETRIYNSIPVPVNLKYSDQDFIPLNKKLYGFNSRYYSTKVDVSRLLNHQMTMNVLPVVTRFPGGTISNFYHWECDCLKPEELSNFPKHQKSLWYQKLFKMLSRPNSLGRDAVASWAGENGVSLSLVLNPLIGSSGENLAEFAVRMEKGGGKVELVELGNELYYKAQRGKSMPAPRDYIRYAKKITPDLKRYLPEHVLLGLPFSADDWEWNKSLAGAGIPYDAIILHIYVPSTSIASIEEDQYILGFPKKVVPELLERFRLLCPGKPFWITEWGILDRPLHKRNNSHIGTLFSANMLLTLMNERDVKAAGFHSLFDPKFGLFRFLHEAEMGMFDDDKKISKQYLFWKIMRKIFTDYSETVQVSVDSKSNLIEDLEVNIQLFRNHKKRALLMINSSNRSYTLNLEQFDFKKRTETIRLIHPDIGIDNDYSNNIIPPLSMLLIEEKDESAAD